LRRDSGGAGAASFRLGAVLLGQAAVLAAQAAAHTPLDNPDRVARLLASLREAGARQQAATLAGRLSAVGMFRLFLEQNGPADQFRFGREVDGTPAAPWGWEDLNGRCQVLRLSVLGDRCPKGDPPNGQPYTRPSAPDMQRAAGSC
jgi:hypothetical protein